MRNRKRLKLNIILLVALAIAGIIFFVMFENKEETSIVGATKAYKDHSSANGWYNLDDLKGSRNTTCNWHGGPLNSPSGDFIGKFPTAVKSNIESRKVRMFDFDENTMIFGNIERF